MKSLIALSIVVAIAHVSPVRAESFGLPLELNDSNTTVTFSVDSTWHLVEGKTSGVQGRVALADSNSLDSVQGEVSIPVRTFDTDNTRRDVRLREVMAEPKYPLVRYQISSAKLECPGHAKDSDYTCSLVMFGTLSIRDIHRPWTLNGKIAVQGGNTYELDASGRLTWADFGVEDPSIMIARLHDEVNITVQVKWREGNA